LNNFDKTVKSIKEKTGIEGFYIRQSYYFSLPFIFAHDADFIDSDNKVIINNINTKDAMNYIVSRKASIFSHSVDSQNDYSDALEKFKDGEVAMIINGPWATSSVLSGKEFVDNKTNFGVATFPSGIDGNRGSPIGGHNYVISSKTTYPEESYKLISFINKKENQEKFAVRNNLLPTRKSTYELQSLKNNMIIQNFLEQLKYGKSKITLPQASVIYQVYSKYFTEILNESLSIEEALQSMEKEMNIIFEE